MMRLQVAVAVLLKGRQQAHSLEDWEQSWFHQEEQTALLKSAVDLIVVMLWIVCKVAG